MIVKHYSYGQFIAADQYRKGDPQMPGTGAGQTQLQTSCCRVSGMPGNDGKDKATGEENLPACRTSDFITAETDITGRMI